MNNLHISEKLFLLKYVSFDNFCISLSLCEVKLELNTPNKYFIREIKNFTFDLFNFSVLQKKARFSITFKNAIDLQNIVKNIPFDKLLVETDSPFLPPVPFRGRINEPAYLHHTVLFLSFDFKVNSSENLEIQINSISVGDQNILTKDLIREIKSDLIDFELRQIIYQETKVIKELLIAKAFAPTDKYENEPPGEVSDPVGYKPE